MESPASEPLSATTMVPIRWLSRYDWMRPGYFKLPPSLSSALEVGMYSEDVSGYVI